MKKFISIIAAASMVMSMAAMPIVNAEGEPQMTATTLPAEGAKAELGYNVYTMTFDKSIASAEVTNGTLVSVSENVVTIGVKNTTGGTKDITVAVTDTNNLTNSVTKTITVPDTLVAYADFDSTGTEKTSYYLTNMSGERITKAYYSPGYSGTLSDSVSNFGDIRFNEDSNWTGVIFNSSKAVEKGKQYKMSFYAKRVYSTENPTLVIAQNNNAITGTTMMINSDTMTKYEKVFTAVNTYIPRFYRGTANGDIIIDDLLVQEVTTPQMTDTTIPATETKAELGYNVYTMTFDKSIASAEVTNGTLVSVSENVVTIGVKNTTGGTKDITVAVTDTDGVTNSVTKTITVPNTLVAYADFDSTGTYKANYYITNMYGERITKAYYSPVYSATLSESESIWNDVKFNTNSEWTGVIFNSTKAVETGKWYKMSFYAKPADSEKTPTLGVAQVNTGYGMVTINSDTMTKYEVNFKATMTDLPRFYREVKDGDIIIDDILVQEIDPPVDYTYKLSKGTVTAGASITATLTNERLETMNATALVGLYKDGRLLEVKLATASAIEAGATVTTDAITVPNDINDGEYTVKAFLWDDLTNTLKPLQNAITITE